MMFFFFVFISFLYADIQPKLGEKIFLNGVGGKGEKYFSNPFNLDSIEECENTVTSYEKSSFGRNFRAQSVLTVELKGQKITATLSDFRNLVIKNEHGQILSERKITGATSLYKITHSGKVVAFAVGWHKAEREAHKNVDFTTFRVYLPVYKNNKITIVEKLFNGLSQNLYEKGFSESKILILVEGRTFGSGSSALYYGLPEFIILDNIDGYKVITNLKDLKKYADISRFDLLAMILWLIEKNDVDEFKNYMQESIDDLIENKRRYNLNILNENRGFKFSKEKRNICLSHLKAFKGPFGMETLEPLFNQCLEEPLHSPENEYGFRSWLMDVLTSESEISGVLDSKDKAFR